MPILATSGVAAQAFRLLEMGPISSFGDESEQARSADEQYPVALDACLERCDWSFASKPATLARVIEDSNDPELAWPYQRPADLVRLLEVHPKRTRWRLDHDRLRADDPGPLRIRYTMRVANEAAMPGNFRSAVAATLAGYLAPRWTASANRAQILLERAEMFIELARAADRVSASAVRYDDDADHEDWRTAARR